VEQFALEFDPDTTAPHLYRQRADAAIRARSMRNSGRLGFGEISG